MIEATISLCDPLNPGIGYQVRVTDRDEVLLFSSVSPDTGEDLKTFDDAIRVLTFYCQSVTEPLAIGSQR